MTYTVSSGTLNSTIPYHTDGVARGEGEWREAREGKGKGRREGKGQGREYEYEARGGGNCLILLFLQISKFTRTHSLTPKNGRYFDSKSVTVLSPEPFFLVQICTKSFRPHWESSQHSHRIPN